MNTEILSIVIAILVLLIVLAVAAGFWLRPHLKALKALTASIDEVKTSVDEIESIKTSIKQIWREISKNEDLYNFIITFIESLKSAQDALRRMEQDEKDGLWRKELHELGYDEEALFLTRKEMASLHSEVSSMIRADYARLATRRALPVSTLLKVGSLEAVEFRGEVSYITPKGEMNLFVYESWTEGWKADGLFSINGEKVQLPLYYVSRCMNPIRLLNVVGVDVSKFNVRARGEKGEGSHALVEKEQVTYYRVLARQFNESVEILREQFLADTADVTLAGMTIHLGEDGQSVIVRRGEKSQKFVLKEDGSFSMPGTKPLPN